MVRLGLELRLGLGLVSGLGLHWKFKNTISRLHRLPNCIQHIHCDKSDSVTSVQWNIYFYAVVIQAVITAAAVAACAIWFLCKQPISMSVWRNIGRICSLAWEVENLILNVCCVSGGTQMERYTEVKAELMAKLSLLLVQILALAKRLLWT